MFRTHLMAGCLVIASAGHALADACDDTAARVAAATPELAFKARRDPKSTAAGDDQTVEIHFDHRHGGTVEIFCGKYIGNVVTIDTDTAYPTKEFLALAAKAGTAEIASPASTIQAAMVRCHQRAIRSQALSDEVRVKGGEVRCVIYNDRDFKKTQFEFKKR